MSSLSQHVNLQHSTAEWQHHQQLQQYGLVYCPQCAVCMTRHTVVKHACEIPPPVPPTGIDPPPSLLHQPSSVVSSGPRRWRLLTDGVSRNNGSSDAQAGCGGALLAPGNDSVPLLTFQHFLDVAINNHAEYRGLIIGMEYCYAWELTASTFTSIHNSLQSRSTNLHK